MQSVLIWVFKTMSVSQTVTAAVTREIRNTRDSESRFRFVAGSLPVKKRKKGTDTKVSVRIKLVHHGCAAVARASSGGPLV